MKTALFTYNRRVVVNGEAKLNPNYINPYNVTSFFWELNTENKPILNVFLNAVRSSPNGNVNAYSITFGESIGKQFVDHMEDFLRFTMGWRATPTETTQRESRGPRQHNRKALDVEVIEEETPAAEAAWN